MSKIQCPVCTMEEVLEYEFTCECVTCGHEWEKGEKAREVKDAYGNLLQTGDIVQMITDLKLKGSSDVLKSGTKSKPIRLVEGDHQIDCKMNGIPIALKAQYVKKVN
jgi:protein PhnA